MWSKMINLNKLMMTSGKYNNNLDVKGGLFIIKSRYLSNENNSSSDNKEGKENLLNLVDDAANFNEITNTSWSTTPYNSAGDKLAVLCNEKNNKKRDKINPQDRTVFMFPGQGTLKVGAVEKYLVYPRVKQLFDIANSILGYNILDICLNGPQQKLNKTEYNQPATILTSLAGLEKIWDDTPAAVDNCVAAIGYSVGELTALIFSGALSIEDGIRLAGVRGAAMQHAFDIEPRQGMITVISKPQTKVSKACEEARNFLINTEALLSSSSPICQIAIYLCSETKVLAGHQLALEYILTNGHNLNFRKVLRLPVTGAFHTPLMQPALKPFIKALNEIQFEEPRIPVYSNVTSKPYRSVKEIIKLLPKQIVSPVKWEQIIHEIYKRPQGDHFPFTYDLGSHGTMKTLLGKINLTAAQSCTSV